MATDEVYPHPTDERKLLFLTGATRRVGGSRHNDCKHDTNPEENA